MARNLINTQPTMKPSMSEIPQRKAVFLALALLLGSAVVLQQPAVRADPALFSPPAFLANTTVSYEDRIGFQNLTIRPIATVTDVFGRLVDAYAVVDVEESPGFQSVAVDYVSPHTGLVEVSYDACGGARTPDACVLARYSWGGQGAPTFYGATMLQGRTFSIGDSWTVEGHCSACNGTVRFTIEPPTANSPAEVDYVVNITGRWKGITQNHFPRGLVHMAADSPYPILYEENSYRGTVSLRSITPGDNPIVVTSPPSLKTFEPPLTQVPFVDGRPLEGTPTPGEPAWSEARNATGPDILDRDSSSVLLRVSYSRADSRAADGTPAYLTTFAYFTTFARPGNNDTKTTYDATQSPALAPTGLDPRRWRVTETDQPSSALGTCVTVSPVLWEAVRYALDLGLLTDFTGWQFRHDATKLACEQYSFAVYGKNAALGITETIHFRADGTLRTADVLPPSSSPIPLRPPWPALS